MRQQPIYLKNPNDTLFTFSTNPNNKTIKAILTYTVDNVQRTLELSTTITTSTTNRTFEYHPENFEFKAYLN